MLVLSAGPAGVLAMLAGAWRSLMAAASGGVGRSHVYSTGRSIALCLAHCTDVPATHHRTGDRYRWRVQRGLDGLRCPMALLGLWMPASLWATHAMLYTAAVMASSLVLLSLAAMAVSATAWVSGILTRRKSWRIVGAVDLVVAWLVAAVALVAGATAAYALLLLIASAILLFAVTTLTQANEVELLND